MKMHNKATKYGKIAKQFAQRYVLVQSKSISPPNLTNSAPPYRGVSISHNKISIYSENFIKYAQKAFRERGGVKEQMFHVKHFPNEKL